MNKHQLACQAVLHWHEYEIAAKQRMTHAVIGVEPHRTSDLLSKRFGVSSGYIKKAKKLYKEDFEMFQLVLKGEATLPGNRPNKKEDTGEVFLALYRAYDVDGKLLYIGKTWNMKQRMSAHTGTSKWWDEFSTMTVDRNFETYEELSRAETLAIRQEQPYYNMQAEWYQ